MFTICLSGTYATIEQRLDVIEKLLRSGEAKARALGLAALDEVLETADFSADNGFEFGARSRDYGYQPRSQPDVARWYGAALTLMERLALTEGVLKPELRRLTGVELRRPVDLGEASATELERLFRRFADDGFWRRGLGRVSASDAIRKRSAYARGRIASVRPGSRPEAVQPPRKGTCGGPG